MALSLTRIDPTGADRDALVDFFVSNRFPFHVDPRPTPERVDEAIAAGRFRDDDNDSYWIDHAEQGRIGFLRFEDLTDQAPLFDLRLADGARGKGLAAAILALGAEHVFSTMPEVRRFEGQTREDNVAMRRAFRRAGWVQEAYYREGWPVEGGAPVASVAYSVLRRDWESGETTPVRWDPAGTVGDRRERATMDRPEVVCVCGSARFADEIRAANRDLTFAGVIVLAPGEATGAVPDEQKAALDSLHKHKIDLADRVLVVNPGGYVGASTRDEIAYAHATGTPVSFTHPT